MRCPTCRKTAPFEGNPYRPFCSERCKLIDLGKWATGAYRVPDGPADLDEGDGHEDPARQDRDPGAGDGDQQP
jgi:hypothetical protein